MNNDQLKNFILVYTDAVWNRHDVDAIDEYYASEYAHHDVSRPDVTSLADYKQWARDLLAAFPNLQVSADDLVAEPNKAVKRWTATGTHDGVLAGIPPTGRQVTFHGVSVYRFADERIVESWYCYDLLGLLQQLGLGLTAVEQVPA